MYNFKKISPPSSGFSATKQEQKLKRKFHNLNCSHQNIAEVVLLQWIKGYNNIAQDLHLTNADMSYINQETTKFTQNSAKINTTIKH